MLRAASLHPSLHSSAPRGRKGAGGEIRSTGSGFYELLVEDHRRVVAGVVGVYCEVGDGTDAGPVEALVEAFGGAAFAGVEGEEGDAGVFRDGLGGEHEGFADAAAVVGGGDEEFADFGAVGLVSPRSLADLWALLTRMRGTS